MSEFVIYHNPRCSKSRQTLELLEQNNVKPRIIEYLQSPPSPEMLAAIIKKLGVKPRDIVRTKEEEFKDLNLDLNDDAAVINALCQIPKLLERPIVVTPSKAVVGRPPENIKKLL